MAVIGLIFWGFRRMLINIYNPLAGLTVGFLSFPHLIAYFIFFVVVDVVKLLVVDRIINLLIKLKNPPTD